MGCPGFQVSGDGIQLGFQDFKFFISFPHGFTGLGPSGQERSGEGSGLSSMQKCPSPRWAGKISSLWKQHTSKGMDSVTVGYR